MAGGFLGRSYRIGRALVSGGLGGSLITPHPGCIHLAMTETAHIDLIVVSLSHIKTGLTATAHMVLNVEDC